jgi:probable HAF family extracellular repeat protein
MRDLGSLGGTFGGVGDGGLNNKGEVVGMSDLAGDQNAHPFLWRSGQMIDLGTPNGDFGFANAINQRGDSTGAYFASDGTFHGVLWRGRHIVDLPPVGGAAQAFGNSINNRDQVVGNQDDSNFNEISAVLWTGGHGYDLNTLVAPSAFQMISGEYINNTGEIFGHGVYASGPNAGNERLFLLIRNPSVPLPANSTGGRPLPSTHPANLTALSLHAPITLGHDTLMSAAIRRILLNQMR